MGEIKLEKAVLEIISAYLSWNMVYYGDIVLLLMDGDISMVPQQGK